MTKDTTLDYRALKDPTMVDDWGMQASNRICNRKNLNRVYPLLRYLKKYGINIEDEDAEKFAKQLIKKSWDNNYPTTETVDGLFREWKFWEPYVNPKSLEKFMRQGLLDMFHFHCTATSFCVTNKDMYLGLKAEVLDPSKLPYQTVTTVRLNGQLLVNGIISH